MKPKLTIYWVLLFALALSACRNAETPVAAPLPSLTPVHVAYTPALKPLLPALQTCTSVLPSTALVVDEVPATQLGSFDADMRFRLGEAPVQPAKSPGFQAAVGLETIDIILNARNPVKALTAAQLEAIYLGETRDWGEVGGSPGDIQVWSPLPSDEARQFFEDSVLQGKPARADTWLAPDPTAMLESVAGDANAIGYLPHAWLEPGADKKIRALPTPKELAQAFSIPVLALASQEPQGAARDYLACLQSGAGQKTIRGTYQLWRASSP